MIKPTLEQLQEAVAIRQEIDRLEGNLTAMFGEKPGVIATPRASAPAQARRKRGGLTEAGRKALSEKMKARWAARRAAAPARKNKA